MPADDWAKIRNEKKNSGSEFSKIKRDKEIEKEMKALGLNKEEYKAFMERRDNYHPSLRIVNETLDETVVGEQKVRLSVFINFILAKNPTYVTGPSASGKSNLLTANMNCVMPGDIIQINGSSEKALLEKEDEINKAKYAIILEFNRISSDLNKEILKSWGEGVDYAYSRAKVQGGTKDILLKALPYAVTRADESDKTCPLGVELESRLCELTVNSSQEQTLAVMGRQAEAFEDPFTTRYVDLIDRACLRYHVSNLPKIDHIINPAAQKLKNSIPSVFASARRRFPAFNASACGICLFNWKDRIIGEINNESVMFVTLEDCFLNQLIVGDVLKDAALQLNNVQKIIMSILLKNTEGLTEQQVQQHLRRHSLNNTVEIVKKDLNHLINCGYVSSTLQGREKFYYGTSFYKNFDLTPNFHEILDYMKNTMESKPHYANYVDEYEERFCNPNNLKTISPFTGDVIDILDYKWNSVFKVVEETARLKNLEIDNKEECSKNDLSKWFR